MFLLEIKERNAILSYSLFMKYFLVIKSFFKINTVNFDTNSISYDNTERIFDDIICIISKIHFFAF